jgi:hypothetical protein
VDGVVYVRFIGTHRQRQPVLIHMILDRLEHVETISLGAVALRGIKALEMVIERGFTVRDPNLVLSGEYRIRCCISNSRLP